MATKTLVDTNSVQTISNKIFDDTNTFEVGTLIVNSINVMDFGATGNGTTDDTAAFQLAVNEGGSIYVPSGTYIIDYIDVPVSMTIWGDGVTSILKKKNNSISTTYTNSFSYLFNCTNPNVTVTFQALAFDGNYLGQVTTRDGATTINTGSAIGAFNGSATVTGVGGVWNGSNLTPPAATDRHVVKFINCTFHSWVTTCLHFQGTLSSSSFTTLLVTNCQIYNPGPGVINYHDGVSTYSGVVVPASGYSFAANGAVADFIVITDNANLIFTNNFFRDTRSFNDGTPTTGFDHNMYNLNSPVIHCTLTTGTGTTQNDPLDWSHMVITGNYFEGAGRHEWGVNGLGVIDCYARAGNVSISGNVFRNCKASSVRGKTNCKVLSVTGNTIENTSAPYDRVLGINIGPPTYPSQQGYISITGNVVKNTAGGISVEGLNPPPENSDPDVADDDDNVVNGIVISGNSVYHTTNTEFSNPVMQAFSNYGYGIRVEDAASVSITGNVIDDTNTVTGSLLSEHGIQVRNTRDEIVIANNSIRDVVQNGINVITHTGPILVSGNIIGAVTGYGIQCNANGENIIIGNVLQTISGAAGILAGSSGATRIMVNNNVVKDVTSSSASTVAGINSGSATSATNVQIQNNFIEDVTNAGAGNAYGLQVVLNATPSDNNTAMITGNVIDGSDQSGMFLQDVTGIVAHNILKNVNTAADTAQGGIFFNGLTNVGKVTVRNNTCEGTTLFPTTGGAAWLTMAEATIAAGAITVNMNNGTVLVDTEADAATDDLDTINGIQDGDIVTFRAHNSGRDVVFKDGTGNMKLNGDFTANNIEDTITLRMANSTLYEVSRSDNGA